MWGALPAESTTLLRVIMLLILCLSSVSLCAFCCSKSTERATIQLESNKEKRKRIHIARDEAVRPFTSLSSTLYCSGSLPNLKWAGESIPLSGRSEDNKWRNEKSHTPLR